MGWSGQEGSAWIGRGGDPSAVVTPLRGASGGSKASELLIDLRYFKLQTFELVQIIF